MGRPYNTIHRRLDTHCQSQEATCYLCQTDTISWPLVTTYNVKTQAGSHIYLLYRRIHKPLELTLVPSSMHSHKTYHLLRFVLLHQLLQNLQPLIMVEA